jgi:hypothetical protein
MIIMMRAIIMAVISIQIIVMARQMTAVPIVLLNAVMDAT